MLKSTIKKVNTTVETKLATISKEIPRKIYLQYEGKEIAEDALLEKFKFEWCKKYRIKEINNLKIYYNIDNKKAYFVVNESVTIIIDFK